MQKKDITFEKVVLREVESLYRFANRLTRNQNGTEDLVQETLLRAYRGFHTFDSQNGQVKAWLFKILHHVFFDNLAFQKRQKRNLHSQSGEPSGSGHLEKQCSTKSEGLDWEEFDEEVKKGIRSLPSEQRVIFLLWSLDQMSYREIANLCHIPVGTVMSRLFRARKELSERLADYAKRHNLTTTSKPKLFSGIRERKITFLKR